MNDCDDLHVEGSPPERRQESSPERERLGKGTVMTSTPADAPRRTSENSGRSSTSECEVHRGSLWDSDDEDLPPLSGQATAASGAATSQQQPAEGESEPTTYEDNLAAYENRLAYWGRQTNRI
ncbi:hypothetical protein MTO96_026240 [Rhipicephalus appendiculatus]